jgi:hypothetical protein
MLDVPGHELGLGVEPAVLPGIEQAVIGLPVPSSKRRVKLGVVKVITVDKWDCDLSDRLQ